MSDNTTEDTGLTQEEIDVIEEKEMIDEGAPVSPATEPVAETAERMEAAHERAEEAEGDAGETGVDEPTIPVDDSIVEAHERAVEQTQEELEAGEEPEQTPEQAAAAALGDTEAVDEGAENRKRLREFTRELKKLPGQWYIIQSYSGYENKVKTNLDMRAQTLEVEDSIYDVVVPIEQVVEKKDGKRKIVKRKLLPGYVLVRMDMNDAAWSVVRETPGVTSFVGNEGNATPVKHRDVAKFLMPKEAPVDGEEAAAKSVTNSEGETVVATPGEEAKKIAHDFEVGEAVTILSGALASVSATINAIDEETGKIQALVSIFGRETPVELTADQVERIN